MGNGRLYQVLKVLAYAAFVLAAVDLAVTVIAAVRPNTSGAIPGVLATVTCLIVGLALYAIVDLKGRIDDLKKAIAGTTETKGAGEEQA